MARGRAGTSVPSTSAQCILTVPLPISTGAEDLRTKPSDRSQNDSTTCGGTEGRSVAGSEPYDQLEFEVCNSIGFMMDGIPIENLQSCQTL